MPSEEESSSGGLGATPPYPHPNNARGDDHADALSLPFVELPLSPAEGSYAFDLRRSDHASFWDDGFPAAVLTDTADFRNLNYHCGNGQQELSEECDDAGASASCDANCFRVPEPASGLLQLTALLTLLALRRRQSLRR